MRKTWVILTTLSLALLGPTVARAEEASDTAQLKATLAKIRGAETMPTPIFAAVQRELVEWVDARVQRGSSIDNMNRELRSAGLLPKEYPVEDARFISEQYKSHVGWIGEVGSREVHGADDVRVIMLGIYVGTGCSRDDSAIIYTKGNPRRRMAELNNRENDEKFAKYAFNLASLAISAEDRISGARLVASAWVMSNCTSTWNGKSIRIDRLSKPGRIGLEKLFTRSLFAQNNHEGEAVSARILDGSSLVSFGYRGPTGDSEILSAPSVARYRVTGKHVIRIAPVAFTRAGFLYEWLHMSDAEAAQSGTTQALAQRKAIAAQLYAPGELHAWENVANCGGNPQTWEIAVRADRSRRLYVFRVAGTRASKLRMLSIASKVTESCIALDGLDNRVQMLATVLKD